MAFASSGLEQFAPARVVFGAIVVSMSGIALLLVFIIVRRWMRTRYFVRRDAIAAYVRQHWEALVSGKLLPTNFRTDGLAREVLEAILLDRIEVAKRDELPLLVDCLRRSGVLDVRIHEARTAAGWRQRSALVILGRTRAPEAVPALSEGLESADVETRVAAVRGLGKIADPAAALPMLDRFTDGRMEVPWGVLKNALLSCSAREPEMLTRYLRTAQGTRRDLLARVLSEVVDSASCDELLILVSAPAAEIRASAARGLGRVTAEIALSPLAQLASDKEWFVRLRAVVALGSFIEHGALPVLVRVLGDRNRLVRQRAAWALIRSPHLVQDVLREVVAAGDDYGLQAVVAELDRCGLYRSVLEQLKHLAPDSDQLIGSLDRARASLLPPGHPEGEPAAERTTKEAWVA
jgi:HEAT repeat protein